MKFNIFSGILKKNNKKTVVLHAGESSIAHLTSEMMRMKLTLTDMSALYTLMSTFAAKNSYLYNIDLHTTLLENLNSIPSTKSNIDKVMQVVSNSKASDKFSKTRVRQFIKEYNKFEMPLAKREAQIAQDSTLFIEFLEAQL